ncbi:aldose epimerase family protein [Nocardia sp. NPDC058114]|uniref:aldose epimerase family protein n=1 Tax=Nocardia sp. NPDC058114 TaxID=3346346 RepID=UPI0036D95CEB
MTGFRVRQRAIGRTRRGSELVSEFELDNGAVRVAVWEYGATLVRVEVPDLDGGRHNLVVGLPTLADYETLDGRVYLGTTLGRFARVVGKGQLIIEERRHQLRQNAGAHHIHGGPEGFDTRVWQGRAESGMTSSRVIFELTSPDGDQGYPGTLSATTTYELDANNRLTVDFDATTDATTLCGLSTHTFWNLGDTDTIDDHELGLRTTARLQADAEFVPTGILLPVSGTAFDFSRSRVIGSAALDAFLVLDGGESIAVLHDPVTLRSVVVGTDQTGLAVYTGDHLPNRPRAGLCLQPSAWPDAPNQHGFPSALLRPGENYHSRTTFDLLFDGLPDNEGNSR